MLYLKGSYGIGPARQLRFAPGVAIMAEDSARFVAVGGNTKGIKFTTGSGCPHTALLRSGVLAGAW